MLTALTMGLSSISLIAQDPLPTLVTLAASDFEINTDGWRGTNYSGGTETLTRLAGGATPQSAGYISVSETAGDSDTMYFAAPAKFLGDQHVAYNGLLQFSLKQSQTSNLYQDNDVFLASSNLTLSFLLRPTTSTVWRHYEVALNENVGWFNHTTNRLATRDDILTVLKSLQRLWIRAEYSGNNADRGDLDDVKLLGQPSGPSVPTLAIARYAGLTIDGEVGATYRIEYRDVLDDTTNWQTLADVILPVSPYLFIDQTSADASSRFYRAVFNQ